MKRKYTYLIVIFLIIASFAAFGRIAGNDFINYDDEGYITKNIHIKSGINPESIKWAFTSIVVGNWHPLTMIFHTLDWTMFGTNASGHHIVSLFLHVGAVIFLFLFLNKTTNNIWSAAFAAAFFALHPLRVESVAWASERKDVLSMFFGMASLYAYAFYAESPRLSQYFLCLILFALSLLAKSMLVTLPFVFLLLDYWPLERWQKEINLPIKYRFRIINTLIGEKIPFFFLTIISSIMTIWTQYAIGSIHPPSHAHITNAIISYTAYLVKIFWPFDLTVFYPFEHSFALWQFIIPCMILSGITINVIYFFKKLPFLFVGWFWYLGTLIPVIGLMPFGLQAMADRYSYLPSIGIAVMLSWGIPSLIRRENAKIIILFPIGLALLVTLSVLTWQQCGYWKNSIELWNHALKVTKNNYSSYSNLGFDVFTERKMEEALHHQKVIGIRENSFIYYSRGNAYAEIGQHQIAIEDYNEAIRLKPDYADAYNNRSVAYSDLGQHKISLEDANTAIRLKPDCFFAYNNRGNAHLNLGQYQLAIEDYNEAIRLKPDYANAYNNRAVIYLNTGNKISGCSNALKACKLGNCKMLLWARGKKLCN